MKLSVAKPIFFIAIITGSLTIGDFTSTSSDHQSILFAQFPPRPLKEKPIVREIRNNDDRKDKRERLEDICDRRLGENELDDCREEARERRDDRESDRRPSRPNITR